MLKTRIPDLRDSAFVNFDTTERAQVKYPLGRSYWFRWGDIKHLNLFQVQSLIGDLASAGVEGNAKVVLVAADMCQCVSAQPSKDCFWPGNDGALYVPDDVDQCHWQRVPSTLGYVEYVASVPINVECCVRL